MTKVVALLESLDTKLDEALFAKEIIQEQGLDVLLIDNSTKGLDVNRGDYTPVDVLSSIGISREEFELLNKPSRLETMTSALMHLIPKLNEEGKIHGIVSIGGGQNGNMAASAMKMLPFGFPKVLSSTLACGVRQMEQFVGEKDIFVFPTIADISGLNPITKTVIRSVCSAVVGLVNGGYVYPNVTGHKVIAATMLGETTKSTVRSLDLIKEGTDYESVVFHANGVGGRCMEALMGEGRIDGVLDFTTHELTCEVLGGYCAGAHNRLLKALELELPMVVVPGGLDMIDYYIDESGSSLPKDLDQRKQVKHNAVILHCKVLKHEMKEIVELMCERLSHAKKPVTVVVPTKGCSETTSPGGPCYDEEVDEVMVETFKKCIPDHVKLVFVEGSVMDDIVSDVVAKEFKELIQQYGW